MRREKYVFNRQTLQYEKVVEPLKHTILRIFGFVCAAAFTALIMLMITHRYFPSPAERLLMQENDILRSEIDRSGQDIADLEKVVANLQDRDAYVYRAMFKMNPIDDHVWNGGIGGHDRYDELRELPRTGEHMAELREKLDGLKMRMNLQSRSLDSLTLMADQKEEFLAAIPSIRPVRADKVSRKLLSLSGFGFRIHPIYKRKRMHWGIDFNAVKNTPIQATGAGTVEFAGNRKDGYGNVVVIDHGFGFKTLYAHMEKIMVKKGEKVKRSQEIGLIGSTGQSTGDHLHYEVIKDGVKVDPIQYCTDGLTPEEYQELVRMAEQENQSFDGN